MNIPGSVALGTLCGMLILAYPAGRLISWLAHRKDSRLRSAIASLGEDDALALLCKPCNSERGKCICITRCPGQPDCAAPAPVTGDFADLIGGETP
jgi:hypothetical protein